MFTFLSKVNEMNKTVSKKNESWFNRSKIIKYLVGDDYKVYIHANEI